MNKILFHTIIFLLIIFIIPKSVNCVCINNIKEGKIEILNLDNSHIVLIEYFTTSFNPDSSTISNNLYDLYTSESLDFSYITHIIDINDFSLNRANDLKVNIFPSLIFDGGYIEIIGNDVDKTEYEEAIIQCLNKNNSNINIFMDAMWTSSPCFPEIIINIEVGNTGNNSYIGHLIIYVVEIRTGYEDYFGRPFDFVLENYAFNDIITIEPGPLGIFKTEIIHHPYAPGCYRFNAPNYVIIASIYSNETKFADATTIKRIVPGNQPTQPQKPYGNNTGKINENIVFRTKSIDMDGHNIKYGWDWNSDWRIDEWTSYYESGEEIEIEHKWLQKGDYIIRVKAIDEDGFESFWSNPSNITISRNKSFNHIPGIHIWLFERFPFYQLYFSYII